MVCKVLTIIQDYVFFDSNTCFILFCLSIYRVGGNWVEIKNPLGMHVLGSQKKVWCGPYPRFYASQNRLLGLVQVESGFTFFRLVWGLEMGLGFSHSQQLFSMDLFGLNNNKKATFRVACSSPQDFSAFVPKP